MIIHTGNLLKSMREYRNLTQQQVADLLGKTKGNVAQLEASPACATRIIYEWCAALEFSIEIKVSPIKLKSKKNKLQIKNAPGAPGINKMKKIDESGIDLRNREEVESWADEFAPKIADRILQIYDASYEVAYFLMELRRQYPGIVSE